jgi:hypothetical protein
MANEPTYAEVMENFRPQFGNANHIAAVRIIPKIRHLQARIDKYSVEKKACPKPVLKEIESLERRVVSLLKPNAPLSTYPPSYPQNEQSL